MPPARLALAFVGCLMALAACVPPPPGQRVADAARELNIAARFGRMDVAMERTADGARSHFMERRRAWGGEVRVLDVELTGLEMKSGESAVVLVDVSWVRASEGTLRMTRIAQDWHNEDRGWQLVRERRLSGDIGLFGEPVTSAPTESSGDVHFPSRTIR